MVRRWASWLATSCWIGRTDAAGIVDEAGDIGDETLRLLVQGSNHRGELPDHARMSFLSHLVQSAKIRKSLSQGSKDKDSKVFEHISCPERGAGVGNWANQMEEHHYKRHKFWAEDSNFCESTGLWTGGCGVMCPLRAAVIGTTVGLGPGQRVLDIGSACGHFAQWFYEWFGASTFGVDFLEQAVQFANVKVAAKRPAKFCWLDIARRGLDWVPKGEFDLATAVSVLHYLKTDTGVYEHHEWLSRNLTRTPCHILSRTKGTQCRAAKEMFTALRRGGSLWIQHNGSYKGKWDPKRVWGTEYWSCCFHQELQQGKAEVHEVPEDDLFLVDPGWDPTYSVIVKRLG